MTVNLLETFQSVNPDFSYHSAANPRRVLTIPSTPIEDYEYDNSDHNYILHVNDQIVGPRRKFLVQDLLGTGSFGQVVKCVEKFSSEVFAIKLVKNLPAYHNQGLVEVSILERLNQAFDTEQYPLLRLYDHFVFRNHLCLVFELLGVSLFDLLKMNKYHGISMKLVRIFTEQILIALQALDEIGIIHCDLKPENILLEDSNSPAIKVIDFGSACQVNQTVYTYIQSRFYRAPEVLLGLPYGTPIDVWSAGCVCFELFWGLPIFPGQNQHRMLKRIEKAIGPPPVHLIDSGKYSHKYYEKIGGVYSLKSDKTYMIEQKTGKIPQFRDYFKGAEVLEDMINAYSYKASLSKAEKQQEKKDRQCLAHFLRCMLMWEPEARWKPARLLQHPFITNQPLETLFAPQSSSHSSLQSGLSHHSSQSRSQTAAQQPQGYYGQPGSPSQYYSPNQAAPTQYAVPYPAGYQYLSSSAPTVLPGIYQYAQQHNKMAFAVPPPGYPVPPGFMSPQQAMQMQQQAYQVAAAQAQFAAQQRSAQSSRSSQPYQGSPNQSTSSFGQLPTANTNIPPATQPLGLSGFKAQYAQQHGGKTVASSAPTNPNGFALFQARNQPPQQQTPTTAQKPQKAQPSTQKSTKKQNPVEGPKRKEYLNQRMDISTPESDDFDDDDEEYNDVEENDEEDDMLFEMESNDDDQAANQSSDFDDQSVSSSDSSYLASAESTPFEGYDSSNNTSQNPSRRSSFSTNATPGMPLGHRRKPSSSQSSSTTSPNMSRSSSKQAHQRSASNANISNAASTANSTNTSGKSSLASSNATANTTQRIRVSTGNITPLSPRSLHEVTEGVASMSITGKSPSRGFMPIQQPVLSAQQAYYGSPSGGGFLGGSPAQGSYPVYQPGFYNSPGGPTYAEPKLGISPGAPGFVQGHAQPGFGSPQHYVMHQMAPGSGAGTPDYSNQRKNY